MLQGHQPVDGLQPWTVFTGKTLHDCFCQASLAAFVVPTPDLQERQRTRFLLQLPHAAVVPFQLLRDGEQGGHMVLQRGTALFTPSRSLLGVRWAGFVSQLLHILSLIRLSQSPFIVSEVKIHTSYEQFSRSVVKTCFHSWKFSVDTHLPSVSVFCFAPSVRCSLSYPGLF